MKYWFIHNGVQLGPVEENELRAMPLTPDTPVWHEGLTDWVAAKHIPALADLFAQQPPHCGPTYAPGAGPSAFRTVGPMPPTYLVWSILATILCCLPLGIPAIVYSCLVTSHYNQGRYAEAERCSTLARNWLIASVVVGIVIAGISQLVMLPAMLVSII